MAQTAAPKPKCTECRLEFLSGDDVVRWVCGHCVHKRCDSEIQMLHGASGCNACTPIRTQRAHFGEFRVDSGDDLQTRVDVVRGKPAQSILALGLLLPSQPIAVPQTALVDPLAMPAGPTGVMGALQGLASKIVAKPPDTYTSNNLSERVLDSIRRRESVQLMQQQQFSIYDIKGAGVTWTQWQQRGYKVADALQLGAKWSDLVDMKFGEFWPLDTDYATIRDIMRVPFVDIFNALWCCSWERLSGQRVPSVVLAALGFSARCFISMHASVADVLRFNYIPFVEFCTVLKLDTTTFTELRPSLEFMRTMQWTAPLIRQYLNIDVQPQTVSVPSRTVVPVRTFGQGR